MEIDFFKNGRKPDFVNEKGFKWWNQDKLSLNYERDKNLKKKGYRWYYVESEDGKEKIHIILRNNDIVYEHTNLESIGVFLDCMTIVA